MKKVKWNFPEYLFIDNTLKKTFKLNLVLVVVFVFKSKINWILNLLHRLLQRLSYQMYLPSTLHKLANAHVAQWCMAVTSHPDINLNIGAKELEEKKKEIKGEFQFNPVEAKKSEPCLITTTELFFEPHV